MLAFVIGLVLGANQLDAPERYHHAFLGKVVAHPLNDAQMAIQCRSYTACIRAAHVPVKGRCEIWFNQKYAYEPLFSRIMWHEVAHCNGWPGNHPD